MTKKEKSRVAIYARVSTTNGGQTCENQLLDLRRYAGDRGWDIFKEYVDNGISGSKDSRPALNELMADSSKRRFDVVLVWRFDRFARSTKHLVTALEQFHHVGIDFVSFQESLDTGSPMGKAMFTIISAIAELERNIIQERVKSGLRRAVASGKRLGRPRISRDVERKIRKLSARGYSKRKISRELGVGNGTVARILSGGE
ncbi:MAG TPA: recombinase family protein [Acidobacteriota bacterium]|jgi:DNA invertase Pin-like site-specific DNA recombinase